MSDPTPPPAEQPAPGEPVAQPAATPPAYSAPASTPAYSAGPVDGPKGLSLTAFILGIASIVLSWAWLGLFAGIAGLILAVLARKREPNAPSWMKTLGLVLSIVGLVLSVIIIIVYIIGFIALTALGNSYNYGN